MHPGFISWWHRGHRHGSESGAESMGPCHGGGPPRGLREHLHAHFGNGPFGHGGSGHGHGGHGHDGSAGFGVRRPLRFLAWKLELEEEQVATLAAILDELKTERAQAEVDHRRTTSAFAEAIEASAFDGEKVGKATAQRIQGAERVAEAVATALQKIHALLDDEQRRKLAYLLRTGALTL